MSQVKANSYYDTSGGSNAILYGVAAPANSMGFRNRIINGNMVIDQRNAGASITPTTSGTFTVDRWICGLTQASKYSAQQSTTAPTGFGTALLITSTSAYSVAAGDAFLLQHKIEGFNFADMAWGTASAQTVTLSFQVRSSLTGTFGGSLQNSAQNRTYPFTFTINSANTYETKTITIAGDTTGTWVGATNGIGVIVNFGLGCGSTFSGTAGSWAAANYFTATGATSVVGTNGATFYITGVQLEAGTVASPFERRDYGRELMMCQRYYETSWSGVAVGTDSSTVVQTGGYGINSSDSTIVQSFRVDKRTNPTCYVWSPLTTSSSNKIRQASNGAIATVSGVNPWGNVFTIANNGTTGNAFQYGWAAVAEL